MGSPDQVILDRMREALADDPVLRSRIDLEKFKSRLCNIPGLPFIVKIAEEKMQFDRKFGREEQKEYYNYEFAVALYYLALEIPVHVWLEKASQIGVRLEKWREEIPAYEFYGVLAHHHSSFTRNLIDYFIMLNNPRFVNAIFDCFTRNTLRKLYNHISLAPRRPGDGYHYQKPSAPRDSLSSHIRKLRARVSGKPLQVERDPRLTTRELCDFVDGIMLVRWPAFALIGKACNIRDASEKGERLKALFKGYPFDNSGIGEKLIRYGDLFNAPKDLCLEVEEYVKPVEFILENYCEIKERTNSPGLSFYEDRLDPVTHFLIETEREYSRKHIDPKSNAYVA